MSIPLLIILRTIHIFAGVFWVGSGLLQTFFLLPAAKATAPVGARFIGHMMLHLRLSMWIAVAAGLVLLTGIPLLWSQSNGFQREWVASSHGLSLIIGALAGLAGAVMGGGLLTPTGMRLARLGQQAAEHPEAALFAEIGGLSHRLELYTRITTGVLVVALLGMALAKYL